MTLLGVDYSTGPLPGATARANGLSFVCRYVSTPSNSKNLKASEVADLSANGIGIVVVFENDPLVGTPMPLRGNAQRTGPAHRQRVDLLAAAGCRGSGGRQMTVHFNGVDFAYGNGVTADQLKAAGVQFVCRYLSDDSSKDISAEELANYKAAGIAVVLNWESTGEMPDEAQGMADAHGAQAEAEALGEGNAPIIFSADFNPAGDTSGMIAYMTGVKSVLGRGRTGIYGCFTSVRACFDAGLVTYGWQTSAWSGGQWDNRAQLQQYNYKVKIGPAQVDQDRAMAQDFGQIGSVAPKPAPGPTPAPTSGGWPTVQQGAVVGDLVQALQLLLNAHAADLVVDGNFGPGTRAAVEVFQNAHNLSVDGIVNGQTWPAIIISVAEGETGDAVRAAQILMGHVPVDGNFGPETKARVVAVQAAHNLEQDGVVGPATWKVLAEAQA